MKELKKNLSKYQILKGKRVLRCQQNHCMYLTDSILTLKRIANCKSQRVRFGKTRGLEESAKVGGRTRSANESE